MSTLSFAAPRPEEVHVWRLALDADPARLDALAAHLSEEECRRAARLHFVPDRERWVAARGEVRRILGAYLGVPPDAVCFDLGPYGKPFLSHSASKRHDLRFNVSHSGGIALVAVTWGREVGVDIECLRADFVPEELAEQVLSLEERASLRIVPPLERCRAFLTLWTGKEAYVKALGKGLSFPLTQLTLRPDPGAQRIAVEDSSDDRAQPRFSLRRLNLEAGCLAALAVETEREGEPTIRHWQQDGDQFVEAVASPFAA